jgi:hypothetical protein
MQPFVTFLNALCMRWPTHDWNVWIEGASTLVTVSLRIALEGTIQVSLSRMQPADSEHLQRFKYSNPFPALNYAECCHFLSASGKSIRAEKSNGRPKVQ